MDVGKLDLKINSEN